MKSYAFLHFFYAASVFGEHHKLEPMATDRKARWRKEIDWLLSVTDHIVEFVPSQQKSKDGTQIVCFYAYMSVACTFVNHMELNKSNKELIRVYALKW